MTPSTINRPILLLPYTGVCTFGEPSVTTIDGAAPMSGKSSLIATETTPSLAQWIFYSTQTPHRMQNLMMHPYSQKAIDAFRGGLKRVPQLPIRFDEQSALSLNGRPVNLTGREPDELYPLINQRALLNESILRVAFHPEDGLYQVHLFPKSSRHPTQDDPQIEAAWRNTYLSDNPTVTTLIVDHSERILEGARELIITGRSSLNHPQVVTVQAKEVDGRRQVDFWVVPDDHAEPQGSTVALQVGDARERLNVRDLIMRFIEASTAARRDGKIPTAAYDLDGTLFNARLYVWDLFKKWLAEYQPRTKEAARIVDEIRKDVAQRTKPIMAWDTRKLIIEHYGVTDEGIIEDIYAHFQEHFYNPKRSLDVPPIPGMVKLAGILQWLGFRSVFPTHRSIEDDQLPDGSSATIQALTRMELWKPGNKLLRHTGPKIDWGTTTVGETPKSAMLVPLLINHPWLWAGTFADNDTSHIGSYRFLKGGVFVHVEGDRPLGKEKDPVPNGVHSIRNTDEFGEEIDRWIEEEQPRLEAILNRRGAALADKFLSAAKRLASWAIGKEDTSNDSSSKTKDEETRTSQRKGMKDDSLLSFHTEAARRVLNEALSYPTTNPLHGAFITRVHAKASKDAELFEALSAILEIVSTHARHEGDPSTFELEAREGVLIDIHRRVGGDLIEDIDDPAEHVTFSGTQMNVSPHTILDVVDDLADQENSVDLFAMPSRDRYTALLTNEFPRMETALLNIVGAYAAMTDKPVGHIRVTEYEPRLSGAVLAALASMGVNTGWHSDTKRFRFHTQRQLDRLPEEISQRIHYRVHRKEELTTLPDSIERRADLRSSDHTDAMHDDIAVFNMPPRSWSGIAHMGKRLVDGGLLVVQSPIDYRDTSKLQTETAGFTNVLSVELSAGDYVLPSAFLPSPSLATPLFLQIWQRENSSEQTP